MPLEIERRLLLKCLPAIEYDEYHTITQAYGPNGRIRHSIVKNLKTLKEYDKYTLTVKKRISKGVNEEVEVDISKKQFKSEFKSCTKIIEKTRFIKKVGKLKWEIDMFRGIFILIAEVEVKTKKELKTVPIPKFIKNQLICDVTGRKEFSNFNLANQC